MTDSEYIIPATLPDNLRASLPPTSQNLQLLGQGSNAVIIRDLEDGSVTKFYGHNRLLDDPYIYGRIQQHFASEIIAMSHLQGLDGMAPTMQIHGRFHPSEITTGGWAIGQVFGWIRMDYLEGIRQDIVAIKHLGTGFKDEQLNDAFFYSVGHLLGKLHQAAKSINPADIQHDVHENDLQRLKLFTQAQSAKWESTATAEVLQERLATQKQALATIEASYEGIVALQGNYTFIHGDFARRNLLYRNNEGQITASAVLDFGAAGIGLPEQDFVSMNLGDKPPAIAGYEAAGGTFSPERYRLVKQLDAQIIGFTAPRR